MFNNHSVLFAAGSPRRKPIGLAAEQKRAPGADRAQGPVASVRRAVYTVGSGAAPRRHRWAHLEPFIVPIVDVEFPDGTRIRALPISERRERDDQRDFGLYMDKRWQPTWPAEVIPWCDFGLPADHERAAVQIEDAFNRAQAGQNVEIGCRAGLGRTGTVLACMAFLSGVPADEAISWVRENYDPGAVETREQEDWVCWFTRRFAKPSY